MAYTIAQLKTDMTGMLHGTSLNKVTGVYDLINRSARDLLSAVDLFETIRIATLSNALYDRIYDYAAPTDLKGDRVIDVRPQVNRNPSDVLQKKFNREFDANKLNNMFSVLSNSGIKTMRISKNVRAGIVLNQVDDIATNGTWAASGTATSLIQDTINYVSGSGSLRFNVSGAGSATLTNSTMAQVDLSSFTSVAAEFLWIYMPTASQVTNVTSRWGSDSSNYYSSTVTTGHYSAFVDGWNLLRFDWSSASTTGTPVTTAMDYSVVTIVTTASGNNYRLDNIIFNMPSVWEMEYYSKYLFRTSAGVWSETCSDDDDIVNLDTDSYNLLLLRCVKNALQQMQDQGNTNDSNDIEKQYDKAEKRYTLKYPSQITQTISTYYRQYTPPGKGSWSN